MCTRGYAYKLYKPRCSNVRANFFSYRVVEVWTSLLAVSVLRVCLLLSALSALLILVDFKNVYRFCVLCFFSFTGGCECFLPCCPAHIVSYLAICHVAPLEQIKM